MTWLLLYLSMSNLLAGSASVDITPDQPVPLSGYPTNVASPSYRDGPRPELSEGVRDPITVRTLIVSDGESTVGIIASDLLNVCHEFSRDIREAAVDLGINEVVVTATHTHSAPYMPGEMLEANPFLAFDSDVMPVVDHIREAFIRCLKAAADNLSPATIRVGRATNDVTAVNRRDEDGPVDPELLVMLVTYDDGEETVLVNSACHPACLSANTAVISADYLATVYSRIDDELDGAMPMFVNGAAGDINPRDIESRYDNESAYTDEIGSEVADTALEAIINAQSTDPLSGPVIASRREPELPLRLPSNPVKLREQINKLDEEIERLEQVGDDDAAFDQKWDRLYMRELLNLHELNCESIPTTMQYLGIGDVGLVSFPGEAFVQHGLDLKDRAANQSLFVAGFANEYVGYLPTSDAFEQDGYEVRTCKVTKEAVRQVREIAFDLLP